MAFKYSCFVSYPYGQHDLVESFVNELERALRAEAGAYFRDLGVWGPQERVRGGNILDPSLAHLICESVCLVAVYSPAYFDLNHDYCAREFRAMEKLEEERRPLLQGTEDPNRSLIIPVVLRKPRILPPEIQSRKWYDFSRYTLAEPSIATSKTYGNFIYEIAGTVYGLHQDLVAASAELCKGCPKFPFPTTADVKPWLQQRQSRSLPLPGRSAA